ncbi:MAG: hypothetical protein F4Z65_03515 [Acidobacteria bacterium]|nr:hypothetical protein [Acidobacteriota bacterium]MYA45326.1 hypothetical protein [Acidobacteriota bacterium]MYI39087.1 hypothetical protein [Acidobacteriota bacterium]
MKMLTCWTRIGGAALLVFVLGLLTKGVADVGELTGTVNALVSRIDDLQTGMDSRFRRLETEIDNRFVQLENRMEQRFAQVDERFRQIDNRFLQMDNRFLRIENVLMGRPPDADDIGGASEAGRAVSNPKSR